MSWLFLFVFSVAGVIAAAAAEVALLRFRGEWGARRRVFTAAAVGPGALFGSPLVLIAALALLSSGDTISDAMLITVAMFALTVGLAAFIGGLIAAFLIERAFQP